MKGNNYRDEILTILDRQDKKGMETYGKTLEENSIVGIEERLTHLQEELIDGARYCAWVKDYIKKLDK